jgi:hypothetical protein
MAAVPTELTPIDLLEVIFSSKGLLGLFFIISGVLWFLLPFAVFGVKGRLDSLITNTSITNKKLDLILQEISISNKLLKESIDVNKTSMLSIANIPKTIEIEQKKLEPKLSDNPLCSKCNVTMQIRTVTKGDNQRKQFYVCSNYPSCRETIKIDNI